MSRCGWLMQKLCGRRDPKIRLRQAKCTDDLIDEAERTRRELRRLTVRLAEHVGALQALTRAYAQQNPEEPRRG